MQQAESKENDAKARLNMLSLKGTLMIVGSLANKSEFTMSATYLFISPSILRSGVYTIFFFSFLGEYTDRFVSPLSFFIYTDISFIKAGGIIDN